MLTIKLLCILLVVLVALGVVALLLDSSIAADDCSSAPRLSTRAYRVVTGCSYIVKFGMVLTAVALVGCLVPAGLGLAMAFAIPKPTSVPKGSWFDHSHNVATTMPFGAIVPIDWRFVQAGEKIDQNISGFARALQLKAPAMQDIDLKWATFFVPFRLLCDMTEEIISKPVQYQIEQKLQSDPEDVLYSSTHSNTAVANAAQFPYFVYNTTFRQYLLDAVGHSDNGVAGMGGIPRSFLTGGLMDYLGFPCETFSQMMKASQSSSLTPLTPVPVNMLPLKAYHAICNHFFVDDCFRNDDVKDKNLVDLMTSQHGLISPTAVGTNTFKLFELRYSQYESDPFTKCSTASRISRINSASSLPTGPDGDSDSVLNANVIRGMFALDEFARKVEYFFGDMRKQIKYMFGVITSDRSAMSPILVDAGSQPIQVSEINNTTLQAIDVTAQRQSAGKMLSSFGKSSKTFEAEEPGVWMTLAWIRPRTAYLKAFNHQFETWLDSSSIPNPLFSEIGDCSIMCRNVFFDPYALTSEAGTTDFSNKVFGYNTRYVLEKYTFDSFTGDFRDNLSYWHCARDFDPATYGEIIAGANFRLINPTYSKEEQSLNRIFSVIKSVDGARPFQLQFRFNTKMWQFYPHIDDEL